MRELRVENPASSNAIGISHSSGSLRLRNVRVMTAAGGSSLGVLVLGGEVVADACEIESAGGASTGSQGTARLHHGRIVAAGALDPVNGQIFIANSQAAPSAA